MDWKCEEKIWANIIKGIDSLTQCTVLRGGQLPNRFSPTLVRCYVLTWFSDCKTPYSLPDLLRCTACLAASHASRLVVASWFVSSDSSRPHIPYLVSLPVQHSLILLAYLTLVAVESSCLRLPDVADISLAGRDHTINIHCCCKAHTPPFPP
jgi:hypothetical protein